MESKRTPPKQNTFFGIPVGTDWKHWYKGVWNTADSRILAPKRFGIGWTINFHAALKKAGLL